MDYLGKLTNTALNKFVWIEKVFISTHEKWEQKQKRCIYIFVQCRCKMFLWRYTKCMRASMLISDCKPPLNCTSMWWVAEKSSKTPPWFQIYWVVVVVFCFTNDQSCLRASWTVVWLFKDGFLHMSPQYDSRHLIKLLALKGWGK